MSELVSILIPAYNSEKWIRDTIKSALGQTWPKKEIIVVEDGSSDRTLNVARRFESRSLKVFTQEKGGASAARNRALSIAQGDYIQWLDADDLLAPDKIANQLERADIGHNSRVLLSSAWGKFYFRQQRAKFLPSSLWQDLLPKEWILRKFNEDAWMAIESWLVPRKLADVTGPWNDKLSMDDDGEYFCRIVLASEKIKFVPQAKSFCRRSNLNSLSNDYLSEEAKASQFISICNQINCLRSLEESERVRLSCLRFLQTHLIYFYPDDTRILEMANSLAEELGGNSQSPL